jgi:hypothetical protein
MTDTAPENRDYRRNDDILIRDLIAKLDTQVIPAINTMKTDMGVLSAKFTDKCDDLDKVITDVGGNGKIGLKTEVELIKKWIETQTWWQRLLIGVIVTNVIGMIIIFIK